MGLGDRRIFVDGEIEMNDSYWLVGMGWFEKDDLAAVFESSNDHFDDLLRL